MKDLKGSIDITVLIVAMTPIVLLLIFASLFLVQENVQTELYAEVSFNENIHQLQALHTQMLDSQTRRKIGRYPLRTADKQNEIETELETQVENIYGTHTDSYSFTITEGVENDIYISNNSGGQFRFSTYVASPMREPVVVRSTADSLGGLD